MLLCFYLNKGFLVKEQGGGGVKALKKRTKTNKGSAGVKPISMFTLWKKYLSFQTAHRVPFDKKLGSCQKFSLSKRRRHFLNFFNERVNNFIVIVYTLYYIVYTLYRIVSHYVTSHYIVSHYVVIVSYIACIMSYTHCMFIVIYIHCHLLC